MQILLIGTIGIGIGAADGEIAAAKVIGHRRTKTVAILFFHIAVFVFTLVLQGEIQAINDAEEVGVTVRRQTAGAFGHEVIGLRGRVPTELREHIGPRFNVVQRTQITTVVEGTEVFQFQTREGQTCFLLVRIAFGFIACELCFPTTITGQLIVNLSFTFKTKTDIALVAVFAVIIGHVVHGFNFAVHIQFISVLIIHFRCLYGCRCHNTHHH